MLQHYSLTPDLLIERFEDESLVFLAASDRWVRLNGTATDLLLEIHQGSSVSVSAESLARILVGQYELDASYALETANGLLDEWTRAGITGPVSEENRQLCQDA